MAGPVDTESRLTGRKSSEKYQKAVARLPEKLRAAFDQFILDYECYAAMHTGRAWVAYEVIADMVLAGWQKSISRLD